jgi:hypothetical protein
MKKTITEKFMYAPIVKTDEGEKISGVNFPEVNFKLYESKEEALRAAKIAAYDLMTAPWKYMSDGRGGNAYGDQPEYRATTIKFKVNKANKVID